MEIPKAASFALLLKGAYPNLKLNTVGHYGNHLNNTVESQMPAGHQCSSMKEKCGHTRHINKCRWSGHDSLLSEIHVFLEINSEQRFKKKRLAVFP